MNLHRSRTTARAAGAKIFFGKRCRKCDTCIKRTDVGSCAECLREANRISQRIRRMVKYNPQSTWIRR